MTRLLNEPPDVVVPIGFGAPCEDGHICALARIAGVPCAGPTPASGSIMQDKSALSKVVDSIFALGCRVRSPRGCTVKAPVESAAVQDQLSKLTPPFVVKPAFSGSSEGLLIAVSPEEAVAAATTLLPVEGKVLIQELEKDIRCEISCTVLDISDGAHFLPIVELRRDDVLVLGIEQKFGVEGLNRHIIPARLDSHLAARVSDVVMKIHSAVGCIGLTRTDILVRNDGELIILELNGIPGLLESSIACDAARAAGISFDELALKYAQSAFITRAEPQIWGAFDA
jgi:D-alanine-D-alanine ligase